MWVKDSYRFLDDNEMAGLVAEPNKESMEYAQASGSILCGCVKESRYRRWLRRTA